MIEGLMDEIHAQYITINYEDIFSITPKAIKLLATNIPEDREYNCN